jgi:predicted restriction endonuclease
LRGRTQSAEAREKNRIANSGANNARWKGGLTNERNILEGSSAYKEWRKAVFERDDYTCHLCLKRGGTLHAHHVLGFSKHPELRLIVSNGLTLCKPCHLSIHRRLHHEDCTEIRSKGERPSQLQLALSAGF